ncbi:MAG: AMP-binding protein [Cytophagaceae bacterium]|jgi:O-succinylbenzoic acid--CoA ligase|nr:AMP-binding protein [Cytophagaceae bacterium]
MNGIIINEKFFSKSDIAILAASCAINDSEKAIFNFLDEWFSEDDHIELQTSGSMGIPKTIEMSKTAMIESARRTINFFELKLGMSALLCLPTSYIAGKMMIVRAIVGHLNLVTTAPSGHPIQTLDCTVDFAAFTPMQMLNALEIDDNPKLRLLRKVIVGGAPINSILANKLQKQTFDVYETYGMTETVSHIALKKLNGTGVQHSFFPLAGITVLLNEDGCIVIKQTNTDTIVTNDIGEILPDGSFRILGRADNVINSGGVKIQPEKVESAIASHLNGLFYVSSVPDSLLGEKVVLVIDTPVEHPDRLLMQLKKILPKYEVPTSIYCVKNFPITVSGKIQRKELKKMLLRIQS